MRAIHPAAGAAVGNLRKHKRQKCVIKSNTRLSKSKKCVCPRCGTAYALTEIPNKEE